eukprot:119688-Prymnesium_polylepis.2
MPPVSAQPASDTQAVRRRFRNARGSCDRGASGGHSAGGTSGEGGGNKGDMSGGDGGRARSAS